MALNWTVCQLSDTSGGREDDRSNRADGRLTRTQTLTFRVDFYDNEVDLLASRVDEQMAIRMPKANGKHLVPQPGETVYYHPDDGRVYSFMICRSAQAVRDPQVRTRFEVTCVFEDPSGISAIGSDPYPYTFYPNQSEFKRDNTIYTATAVQTQVTAWTGVKADGDGPLLEDAEFVLPTGGLYSDPPVRTVNNMTYECFHVRDAALGLYTEEQYNDEIYHCNNDQVKIGPITYEPYELMITDINYDTVNMPIGNHAGGSTDYFPASIVYYTLEGKRWTIQHLPDNGTPEPISPGHRSVRVRADTRFTTGSGPTKTTQWANTFEGWGMEPLYLKTTGEAFEKEYQYGIPPIDLLGTQPITDFQTIFRGFAVP